jgi:hypothetical protein
MQYQIDFLDDSNMVVCELRAVAGSPADALLGVVGNMEWPAHARAACVLDPRGRVLTVSKPKGQKKTRCGSSYKGMVN